MDERDSSTPNEDCWHSTYGNFCKCDQALSPISGRGQGMRLGQAQIDVGGEAVNNLPTVKQAAKLWT